MIKSKAKTSSSIAQHKAKPADKGTKRAAPAPAQRDARVKRRAVRASTRTDDANAFIPDPGEGPARTSDDLAEVLAEDFIASATSGNEVLEDDLDQTLPEELGGPFVATRARDELADDIDGSNPVDAKREPLPRAIAGLVQSSPGDEDEDDEESG
jgi:hypothetical protein